MSRLEATFTRLRENNRKALVIYMTAGDPSLATSIEAAKACIDAGADILEVGIPFSDPLADGPVIQKAMIRALEGGATFARSLELVKAVRLHNETVPIVLFGYSNPFMWPGFENSCSMARKAGADGFLVVDLPPEEAQECRDAAAREGLDWISLVAPSSGVDRAKSIAAQATGFLYVISMLGVTGGALSSTEGAESMIRAARTVSDLPCCVGFGVRDEKTAEAAARIADGVVVGTAVVQELEAGMESGDGPERVGALVRKLRIGADAASEPCASEP